MIPVIFAINNDYVKQLATAIVSILHNSKSNIEFNILATNISDENKAILSKLGKNVNFIDMNKITENFDLEKYMARRENYEYISIETYYRFFIPELFPQYDKILYFDADILVLDDISKFYSEDISNEYAGAVQDMWIEEHLESGAKVFDGVSFDEYFEKKLHKKTLKYFNAGILLLNLAKIRQDNVVDRLWEFTRQNSPLHFQDQDVLNAVFEGYVKFVDIKWNTLKDVEYLGKVLKNKQHKNMCKKVKPGIVHYVGSNKPWIWADFHYYGYRFIKEWWDYYCQTPYFEKSDYDIYKMIKYSKKYGLYFEYFVFKILNLELFSIIYDKDRLRFKIFHFIKTYIRFKKPNYFIERNI